MAFALRPRSVFRRGTRLRFLGGRFFCTSSSSSGNNLGETEASLDDDNAVDEHSVAIGVQDLLRNGYKRLEPGPLIEAAERVGKLPSGSLTRRYLSGFIMNGHGNLLRHKYGDHDPAESKLLFEGAFEHAVEEASQGLGDDRYSDIVSFASDLAINHAANGDLAGSEKLMKRAYYWVSNSRVGPDRPLLTATLSNLGLIQAMMGRYSNAHDNHERAVESDTGDDPVVSAAALTNLSASLRHQGIMDRGEDLAEQALEQSQQALSAARLLSSEEDVSDLAAASQASLVRSAALINAAIYKLVSSDLRAPTFDSVQTVFSLASEAMSLEDKYVDPVPALLLQGLSAPDLGQAAHFYKLASSCILVQPNKSTMKSQLTAVRDNLAVLLDTAQSQVTAACEPQDHSLKTSEIRASSPFALDMHAAIAQVLGSVEDASDLVGKENVQASMLLKIQLGQDRQLWVQEQAPFVTGLTLRSFINSTTTSSSRAS